MALLINYIDHDCLRQGKSAKRSTLVTSPPLQLTIIVNIFMPKTVTPLVFAALQASLRLAAFQCNQVIKIETGLTCEPEEFLSSESRIRLPPGCPGLVTEEDRGAAESRNQH